MFKGGSRIVTSYVTDGNQKQVQWNIKYKKYYLMDLQMDVLKYFEYRGKKLSAFTYTKVNKKLD